MPAKSLELLLVSTTAMAKRKAEDLAQASSASVSKKAKQEKDVALNKSMLLDDSDSDSSGDDESAGGVTLKEPGFKINEEYAKRFEHNKKREELQRCK